MILFSESFPSLSPPSSGSISRMLWSFLTDTRSKSFGNICGLVWPFMLNFRQSLNFDDCTTYESIIIQLWREFFIWSLIFEITYRFVFFVHSSVPDLVYLHFDLAALTQNISVFYFKSNMLVNVHWEFLALSFWTCVGFMGDLVLVLVNYPGVETIVASRIVALTRMLIFNFLMF